MLLTAGAAAGQGTLVVQVATEPPGLDLTASPASAIAAVVFYNVQECLVKIDRHGKLVPWLAERWHTADEKNYTFFLKRGVRFHNGREMKAADVKFAVERAMNPETKHPYPQYYAAITNLVVKDDYTITVTLKSPNAAFLYNMARQGSVIYPREAVDTLKSAPVGTGPFTVAEWVRGDRIVLARNPDYHVKGLPRLDRVTYRFIPDPNAALAALKAGDVDAAMFGIGPEHVPELQRDPRFQVIIGETTNDVILAMNNSRKPYADVRVRRAVTHAINKPEVVKGAMFGLGRVLGSNVDPLNPYFVDLAGAMPYDPARARDAPRRGRLPERLRDGAQGRAPVLLHGAHGRGARPASSRRSASRSRSSRSSGASGCRASGRTRTTTSPSSATPRRGTSPTTPTRSTTTATTARSSRSSTARPRPPSTTGRGATSTRRCRGASWRMRRWSGSTCIRAWPPPRRGSRACGRTCRCPPSICPRCPGRSKRRRGACGDTSCAGSSSFGATLLFVSALAFAAVRVLPGDPALLIMGPEGNPEATARLRSAMGLDRPIPVQYVEWLGRARARRPRRLDPVRRSRWRV